MTDSRKLALRRLRTARSWLKRAGEPLREQNTNAADVAAWLHFVAAEEHLDKALYFLVYPDLAMRELPALKGKAG